MTYLDKNNLNNSMLSCYLQIYFFDELIEKNSKRNPDLMLFLLVLPFVWHKSSREAIQNRKFTTNLNTVIEENPLIRIKLKQRITNFSGPTIQGLNLALATGLVSIINVDINHQVTLVRTSKKLPSSIKNNMPKDMIKAIKRLANWYANMDTVSIYHLLLGNSICN
ncbi:three component ABC system middle component [Snodgrassella sp. M0351]|uniref:three component ABC system middle component n=1 Tax=Snodgrassella sp. M0351 TaxID=2751012 RepID=UPI0018DB5B68|nr:three component ABC system middle component [Snodgrassella sp. M0351]MBI0165757.1 hypothetical protein [Snodgrassella sp. M0351]